MLAEYDDETPDQMVTAYVLPGINLNLLDVKSTYVDEFDVSCDSGITVFVTQSHNAIFPDCAVGPEVFRVLCNA
jgi:hypothetical protein